MRFVVLTRILGSLGVITLCGIALAQVPEPKNTGTKEESKTPDLGPATSKTRDEAAEAVKAPVSGPALPTAMPVDPKTYLIGPEDILMIKVWKEGELSGNVQVRPDGKITLPLVGELQASGATPEGLKGKIVEALSEFINKPEVTVFLMSVQSKKFHIMGEVSRPGSYPLVVPVTILEALTNAGGFREFANTKKITILRNGKTLKFNYNDVIKGKNMQQNIPIENGDYIVVP
jgi:polysaccharide export outer membrane protein